MHTPFVAYQDNRLVAQGHDLKALGEQYGTPLYIYDESTIIDNFDRLYKAFHSHYEKFRVLYAVKANSALDILNVLARKGLSADCSSAMEILLAQKAGFPMVSSMCTAVNPTDEDLEVMGNSQVLVNIDDLSILDRLRVTPQLISFRVNIGLGGGKFPQITTAGKDAKFGIQVADVVGAYRKAYAMGIRRFGIHVMAGSCELNPHYFEAVTTAILNVAETVSSALKISFEFIDIGGGFGIPYEPFEQPLDIERTAKLVTTVLRDRIAQTPIGYPQLIVEPGRYLVGNAGILLTRVSTIKESYSRFIGVDAGMSTMMRPALYGAFHEIVPVEKRNASLVEYHIVGPICETTDCLAKSRLFQPTERGDYLAILDAGAYCFAMASQYNGRLRPAEVLIRQNKSIAIIRRRETFDDWVRNQLEF